MNCRDVRDNADSFLSEELLTETNQEILRHLGNCPPCRREIDLRRRLRVALRDAFSRAPDLRPSLDFERRLRHQLREVSAHGGRHLSLSRQWLALVASLVIAAGVVAVVLMQRTGGPAEALARDAVGDHQNCALRYRLARMPVPLEEAAQQFDSAYRVLRTVPPDDISTPDGDARVTERHSCTYGTRRFGHVIMHYRGSVVSLLMTGKDEEAIVVQDAVPHLLGRPMNGLSVVSVDGTHHTIVLVSDLNSAELMRLAKAVSLPLAQRLEVSLGRDQGSFGSLQFVDPLQSLMLDSSEGSRSKAFTLQQFSDAAGHAPTAWLNRLDR
jgi:hypothetical protein